MTGKAATLRGNLRGTRRRPRQRRPHAEASILQAFQPHKVSPAGQLTLPPAARADLQVKPRGYVDVVQVGAGVIVRRSFDRLGYTSGSRIRQSRCGPGYPPRQRFKVSPIGQLSLPAATRRAWGVDGGGLVELAAISGAVIILPLGGPAKLLREWAGTRLSAAPEDLFVVSAGAGGKAPRARARTEKERVLVAGSLLWNVICETPLPEVLRDASVGVTSTECLMFMEAAVDSLKDVPTPGRLRALSIGTGWRVDLYEWLVLLLDFQRVSAVNQMVSVGSSREITIAAEAAVTSRRFGISTPLAVSLAMARDHSLSVYLTAESGVPPVPATVLEHLELKMINIGQGESPPEGVKRAED